MVHTSPMGSPPTEQFHLSPRAQAAIGRKSPTVKTSPAASLLHYLERECPLSIRTMVLSQLTPDEQQLAARKLLPHERVPVSFVNHLTEQLAAALGVPLEKFAREAGARGADEALDSTMRWLATQFMPLKWLIDRSIVAYQSLYDAGHLTVEHGVDTATLELHDFPEPSAAMCGRMSGWFYHLGSKKASNVVVVHAECRAHGDRRCIWTCSWTK